MMTTHEPLNPLPNWPDSHVDVQNVFFEECPECVKITIHNCEHYLHRTTTFELYKKIQTYLKNLSDADKKFLIAAGSDLGEELW